jgi:aminopeptidase N
MQEWKFRRSEFRRPPAQLEHVEATIRFFEDRVEAEGVLHLVARGTMREMPLDCDGARVPYALDREYSAGERFTVKVSHVSHPDGVRLEGIYRDATPDGAPQQYMSQCQQFGFQRILPIVDDCTAKCTFRTTLEGDERYTHLISNGDLVEKRPAGPGRMAWTYENRRPMAPYLFIACAGTWDVLSDSVTYPGGGKTVRLEYLVPPGRVDGARVPMEILKKSIVFQHELTGFVYPYETYRTICMEKSLYGGMENTGNTTIVTQAALIDSSTSDARLVYAHGVIPHEYEHSHCGSGVTMETPFDMWLNEAYTVNVERAFLAREFGDAFMRAMDVEGLRMDGGALAEDESGSAPAIVREGVNDPDDVVDAITYDKAPEVLNTLRSLIGAEAYDRAWREYFRRFDGGNANTGDFLKVFSETTGRDVGALMRPWLFSSGHPTVRASWTWAAGELVVTLAREGDYVVPVPYALVKDGRDVASGAFVLDGAMQQFRTKCPKPDFISWNRGYGFYGVLKVEASVEELVCQVRTDPDAFNRAEAMKMLRDKGAVDEWTRLYGEVFADGEMDLGTKEAILAVGRHSLDRRRRAFVRENAAETHALRRVAAEVVGEGPLVAALEAGPSRGMDAAAIVRRAWDKVLLDLLAELDTPGAWSAIEGYLSRSENITARLNALAALARGGSPRRREVLEAEGAELRKTTNGYAGYLRIVACDPHEDVFAAMDAEERREGWSMEHPALSRALYCGFTANADRLWTDEGLAWIERTMVKYVRCGEYNAQRLLSPFLTWRWFEPGLREEVGKLLERLAVALPREKYPSLGGRIADLLA